MARRRRRKALTYRRSQRDAFAIATRRRAGTNNQPPYRLRPLPFKSVPLHVEDLRQWHPSPLPPSRTRSGTSAPVDVYSPQPQRFGSRTRFDWAPPRLAYVAPEATMVCARRQERTRVLHARGVAGGRVSPVRRFSFNSQIVCRR